MDCKRKAFTLIELLVVIVIIGILSGIGISQMKNYTEKARLATAKFAANQVKRLFLAQNASGVRMSSFLIPMPSLPL